jgi:hypothetical protein
MTALSTKKISDQITLELHLLDTPEPEANMYAVLHSTPELPEGITTAKGIPELRLLVAEDVGKDKVELMWRDVEPTLKGALAGLMVEDGEGVPPLGLWYRFRLKESLIQLR